MPILSGKTRDGSGTPLGDVSIKVFLTANNSLVATGSSDVNGDYSIITEGYGPFYLVAYKDGSTDLAGTTRNDLMALDNVTIDTSTTAVTNLWTGAQSDSGDGITIVAELPAFAADVRLAVSASPDLSNPVYSSSVASYQHGGVHFAKIAITGLQPNTQYYYGIRKGSVLYTAKVGKFKTKPVGPASFTFAFGSCIKDPFTANLGIWEAILARNPLFFFSLGDAPYLDQFGNGPTDASRHSQLAAMLATGAGQVYKDVPTYYVYSDHDFYGNNYTGGSIDSTTKAQIADWYRKRVPHEPLVTTGAIYRSWVVGRVRFIVLDCKAEASDALTVSDSSTKTMLGATQKQWFKDQITAAKSAKQYVVIVSDVPWIRPGAAEGVTLPSEDVFSDKWWSYSYERRELADHMKTQGMEGRVLIISGDAHMLAFDSGANADYATGGGMDMPAFVGAPLDNGASTKPGTYSGGTVTTRGQAGVLTFTDTGSGALSISFKGIKADGSEALSYPFISVDLDAVDTTPPQFTTPATISVDEGSTLSHTIQTNESATLSIIGGADAAKFTLNGNILTLPAQNYEDPSHGPAYYVTVRATDAAGNTNDQPITVNINDVNESATDPYWANVVFLAGFEGTNGQTSYSEEKKGRAATFVADAKISTNSALTGSGSLLLDGQGDHITFAANTDWRLVPTAGAKFTLDIEVTFTAVPTGDQYIISQYDNTTNGGNRSWALFVQPGSNRVAFQWSVDGNSSPTPITLMPVTGAGGIVAGQKYRFRVESDGTDLRGYVDGVMPSTAKKTGFGTVVFKDSTAPLAIGARTTALGNFFAGRVDEVRIALGVARCGSDAGYTVESGPFPRG